MQDVELVVLLRVLNQPAGWEGDTVGDEEVAVGWCGAVGNEEMSGDRDREGEE